MWEKEGILKRYIDNPILLPQKENDWESKLVYNCAAVKLDGIVYLIYRAMGKDHISRFGLAFSKDGINFKRFSYPVFLPKFDYEIPHSTTMERERERGGVEDPRAMIVGDFIYLVYTAYHKKCHIAMARMILGDFKKLIQLSKRNISKDNSKDWNDAWERVGLVFPHLFEMPDYFSRNSVLMGLRNDLFLLFYRINTGDILISLANHPEGPWEEKGISFISKQFKWEQERIGISTPPINVMHLRNNKNLLFYHGVEESEINNEVMKIYHLGAFFLTANVDGDKLILKIERLKRPILEPVRNYEVKSNWLLSSGVQAVFSCGAVAFGNEDIYIYYGSGDSNISLGKVRVTELLQEAMLVEHKEIDLSLFPVKV